MAAGDPSHNARSVRARIREFQLPPVRDALVLGRNAPIGCVAMRSALELLNAVPFEHIEFEDDVVSDILVRRPILHRLPREKLIAFVVDRIKPLMTEEEVLDMTLEVEVMVEGEQT